MLYASLQVAHITGGCWRDGRAATQVLISFQNHVFWSWMCSVWIGIVVCIWNTCFSPHPNMSQLRDWRHLGSSFWLGGPSRGKKNALLSSHQWRCSFWGFSTHVDHMLSRVPESNDDRHHLFRTRSSQTTRMLNLKASTCRPIGLVEYNPHLDSSLRSFSLLNLHPCILVEWVLLEMNIPDGFCVWPGKNPAKPWGCREIDVTYDNETKELSLVHHIWSAQIILPQCMARRPSIHDLLSALPIFIKQCKVERCDGNEQAVHRQ